MFKRLRFALLAVLAIFSSSLLAQDTIVVQTLNFDSITTRRGIFEFPPEGNYRKILMEYTLKCDAQTTQDQYACGEWDYLTYNNVYDHTGVLDSNAAQHAFFLVGNAAPDSIEMTTTPLFNQVQGMRYMRVIDNVISESEHLVGTGGTTDQLTFDGSSSSARAQYLFTASELSNAGLGAGSIDQLRFNASAVNGAVQELHVRMKATTESELTTMEETGLSSHFRNDLAVPVFGQNTLVLETPFDWDGSSNLLVEIGYANLGGMPPSLTLDATDAGSDVAVNNNGHDGYLRFRDDHLSVPVGGFANITEQITVSFWQFGDPSIQPINNYSFEGLNSAGQRVLNVHLPWSNGRVYWDAGNDGGSYDRIDKAAVEADYEGQWNHWAFTKNSVTGQMKIYLNGTLWHTGNNKFWDMDGITEFRIGGRGNGDGGFYAGDFDEFRIWNKELDASTIQDWMRKEVDGSHPDYANLLYYYPFNEEPTSFTAINIVNNSLNAQLIGAPGHQYHEAAFLHRNSQIGQVRPDITFVQGNYDSHLDSNLAVLQVAQAGETKVDFQVMGNGVIPIDTLRGWESGWTYLFNEQGDLLDSTASVIGNLYYNHQLDYFEEPFEVVDRYEIGRFITPYGISLSLGSQGFQWQYDVTDYAWLLHDSVDLSAGNQQELIDLKFLFIEGTPAREVKQMDRIWGARGSHSYANLDNDVVLFDTTYALNQDASQWKVLTRLTGHGHNSNNGNYPHCCEWKDNTHYLFVDGQQVADWHIWQEHDCANNPVYPQGGTWLGAREGWCPGDVVKDNEFEITQHINGSTVSLDYDITDVPSNNQGMGGGNYVVAMQLFHYGDAAHNLDAEIYEVLQPTDLDYHERWNPICIEPQVVLRNAGATTLTSATLSYHVSGGQTLSHEWTGSLKHMEKTTVTLPVNDGAFWLGDGNNNFHVSVASPNGAADEYADNDNYISHFELPEVYPMGGLVVWMETNNRANENSYTFRDQLGNIVYSKDNMSNDTEYRDTVYLDDGCYTFHFLDEGNDGLSYWADPAAGNGFLRFRKLTGGNLELFQSEFGRDIHHAFSIGGIVGLEENGVLSELEVFPNPSNGQFTLMTNGVLGEVEITVLDALGRTVHQENDVLYGETHQTIDLSGEEDGIYLLRLNTEDGEMTQRVVKQ